MLFLTFCREDAEAARALAEGLERAGQPVWCSAVAGTIPTGEWTKTLYDALEKSDGYLILIGDAPLERRWVDVEIDWALNLRAQRGAEFKIVPLLLPGRGDAWPERLPKRLATFEALRLREDPTKAGPDTFVEIHQQLGVHSIPAVAIEAEDGPFPGLEPFDQDRAPFFFGRTEEVRDLCARLGQTKDGYRRWLHVHGASGAGKSSLVRAGWISAVRRGWLEGAPRRWAIAVFRPGGEPLRNLAKAVASALGYVGESYKDTVGQVVHKDGLGLDLVASEWSGKQAKPDDYGLLVFADQLEEAFTHGGDLVTFDKVLAGALEHENPVHLVTTIRTDFLHRFEQRLPRLFAKINERASTYHLGRVRDGALRLILTGPAAVLGLDWESGLAERIEAEFRDTMRPAASTEEDDDRGRALAAELPMLAHVLRELWLNCGGVAAKRLTHERYEALGDGEGKGEKVVRPIDGAIARSARRRMATIPDAKRERAYDLLVHLVKTGRGEADARRTLTRAEALALLAGVPSTGGEEEESLLATLAGGDDPSGGGRGAAAMRLVRVDGDRVDLIHEALLRVWADLRDRVDAVRRNLELRDDLDDDAQDWIEHDRNPGYLPADAKLAQYAGVKNPTDRGAECLRAATRHARRRTNLRRAVTGVVFVLAVVAGWFAVDAARKQQRLQPNIDRLELAALVELEKELWPKGPKGSEEIGGWLARIDEIKTHVEDHRAVLESMTARSAPTDAESGERQQIEQLLAELGAVDRAAMKARLDEVIGFENRMVREDADAWAAVRARVAANSKYGGISLAPQVGLRPIGPDPASKLEEFAVERTGEVPVRGKDERYEIGAATALLLVLVPAGEFEMGRDSGDKSPRHPVVFERLFFIAKTEVTEGMWSRVMESGASSGVSALPKAEVEWTRAREFCERVGLRLPSEAEWEYACRARTTTDYSFGDDPELLPQHGWFGDNAKGSSHTVARLEPNPWGLYDMHGNVWEWCEDWYHESYEGAPADGSAWVEPASVLRVIRGGSFWNTARCARSALRIRNHPAGPWDSVGFRPARSVTSD